MSSYYERHARNWAVFVVALFVTVGIFNLINALAAFTQDDKFNADELLFGDLSMWATFYLIGGVLQLLTAWLIWRGSFAGQLLGILIAGFSSLIALLSIGAYPIWAVTIIVFNGVVIYALTVYGDALGER
jgi:hypothetical protein